MAAPKGTAHRTLEWTANNRGAGPNRIARWTRQAGFSGFVQWCGVFLGSALRAQGIEPPKGYPLAINWSTYGEKVNSLAEARPGDILVYGSNHVAMYLGDHRQIQGNDTDGTVGDSGVGPSLGRGPITAIRRPPYKAAGSGLTGFEKSLIKDGKSRAEAKQIAEHAEGATAEPILGEKAFEPVEKAGEKVIGGVETGVDLTKAVVGALENPESLMLNIGLLGGGAFLIYYGAALVLGVHKPVAAAAVAATKGAEL